MKRFAEFIDEQFLINEMARVGQIDELEICVYNREGGNVPHIHIRDYATMGKAFDCCVKLEAPEYFDHGCHTDTLTTKQKHQLNDFMNAKPRYSSEKTNYEFAVSMWNNNGSNRIVELEYYDDGRVIIPDYSTLHSALQ